MSDLADLIRSTVPDLSNRQIAERAGLRAGTVDRVMNGVGQPKVETVDKIARALKIPVEQAREAAGKPRGSSDQYVPPVEARLLDDRQRRALDELIRSFVATREVRHEDQSQTSAPADPTVDGTPGADGAPMNVAPGTQADYDLAAERTVPGPSRGQWLREQQDQDAELGDPEGPEGGA